MECFICYTNLSTYVINCGSKVEHKVCDQCEVTMRMKEPATRKGRILKCPMCRENEIAPGKRTAFSYEYELSKMYETAVPPARILPLYIDENTEWSDVLDPFILSLRFAATSTAEQRAERPYHAWCQSGNREIGACTTRGKTERKCSYIGCTKFVCRRCTQCLTH
jgi:hypothetical protein